MARLKAGRGGSNKGGVNCDRGNGVMAVGLLLRLSYLARRRVGAASLVGLLGLAGAVEVRGAERGWVGGGETAEAIGVRPPQEATLGLDAGETARGKGAAGSAGPSWDPSLRGAPRTAVVTGLAVILVQAGLIVGLLAARARRRTAEGALRRSEQRFAGVFRSSPTAICITRPGEGTFVDVNPSWEALFGWKRELVVGRNPQELEALVGAALAEQFQHFNQEGKSLGPVEWEIRLESGRQRWVQGCRELAELDEGPCYITLLEDVTEHRAMEEARRSLAQAARLALLGEMTASIAHEINQPLGAILSSAEAGELLMEQPDFPVEELREILGDIRRDDLRASLAMQRVRALVGKRDFQVLPVSLNEVVEEVLRLVAREAQRRGVRLVAALAQALPAVAGDRGQMEQVLLNLVLNGMEAMWGTAARQRVLRVETLGDGAGGVEVRVEDGGPGIEPGQLAHLFDSFFTTKERGMGLGLALARSMAEAHQGSLTAANRAEGGAVFTLRLCGIP